MSDTPLHTSEHQQWGVRYTRPADDPAAPVRPCETLGHAYAVLAGLPAHYRPAHLVTKTGDQPWHRPDGA